MRLLVSISHHGLGHLAQTAPVLQALRMQRPDIRFVVRSALGLEALRSRLPFPFEHHHEAMDCGFIMQDAIRLDAAASLVAHRELHANWPAVVRREAAWLVDQGIDAVFSNVAYLPLAAAQQAGLPAAALCSLNWWDIFLHYLGDAPGASAIAEGMRAAYQSAGLFIRPEPSMPMPGLTNTVAVPPLMQPGVNHARGLRQRLRLAPDTRLVLIGMGGIGYRLVPDALPATPGIVWLVPDAWAWTATDDRAVSFSHTGLSFSDLLASCDALVTKPGYGSFVEAAAQGVPLLYLPREDWPETAFLVDWLLAHGQAARIDEAAMQSGGLPAALQALWRGVHPAPVRAEGAEAAAQLLLGGYA